MSLHTMSLVLFKTVRGVTLLYLKTQIKTRDTENTAIFFLRKSKHGTFTNLNLQKAQRHFIRLSSGLKNDISKHRSDVATDLRDLRTSQCQATDNSVGTWGKSRRANSGVMKKSILHVLAKKEGRGNVADRRLAGYHHVQL